jgi:hypothetical protein
LRGRDVKGERVRVNKFGLFDRQMQSVVRVFDDRRQQRGELIIVEDMRLGARGTVDEEVICAG